MWSNEHMMGLLAAISKENDEAAYKELYVQMYKRLKQFAYSILKSAEEAEELVDDVFIRLWEKRASLTEIESPKVYLYTAIKNRAFSKIKSNRKTKGQELPPDLWFVPADSFYFNPEEMMVTGETMRLFKQAIQNLPPRCRLIFKLVKEDGLKYREVAAVLDISIKTVEAQMAIAIKRVAKCMHFEVGPFSSPKIKK